MLYRALSLSLLFSFLLSAGDKPEPNFTVKMVDPTPQNPPQMPKVDFQNPYAAGSNNTGSGNSSGVGSTAGGSLINLGMDLLGNKQPSDAEIHKMRTDKQFADFQDSLQKYGEHTTAQFFPALYEKYMQSKNPMPVGFAPSSQPTPKVSAPVVASAPAPVVSTPAPTVATPAPANSSSFITGLGTGKTVGGIQGTTQLQMPTINQLTPPKNYIKPLPVPPTAPSSSSSSEYSDAMAPAPSMPSGDWGQMIKDAGEGAAIVVGAAVIVYGSYKIGEFLFNANKWAFGKVIEEGKKAFGSKPVHVPTPQPTVQSHPNTPQPTVQSHSTPASSSHTTLPDLPERLRPSENPVKLGKKIYQPGPLPGQGDNPHGYKDQFGHYKYYTPENVAHAIESVEKGVWHGQNPTTGKHLYTYECPKTGLQKWAETDNNGAIMNCGINEVRHTYCPTKKKLVSPAGFKKPTGKNVGWVDKTLKVGAAGTVLGSQYSSSTPLMTSDEILPSISSLPPAPKDITVHDLYAERMIKNHYVAMEQKKVITVQDRIKKAYKKRYYL